MAISAGAYRGLSCTDLDIARRARGGESLADAAFGIVKPHRLLASSAEQIGRAPRTLLLAQPAGSLPFVLFVLFDGMAALYIQSRPVRPVPGRPSCRTTPIVVREEYFPHASRSARRRGAERPLFA